MSNDPPRQPSQQSPPPGPTPAPPPPPYPGFWYYPPPPPPRPRRRPSSGGGPLRWLVTFFLFVILLGSVFAMGTLFGTFVGFSASAAVGSGIEPVILTDYRAGNGDTVAIIPVSGVIDGRRASFVRRAVDKVLATRSIKAVVLRVDSPGGGVAASDQIWYQVQRLRDRKIPVVASYGGVAASGGYYVSCHADHIFAERTCITGSIGVIAQIMTMEGLMDKIGVEPVTVVASGSPEKDVANDIFRSWSEEDRQRVTSILDAAYDSFLHRVTQGRSTAIDDPSRVRELADGSIYTAQQALDNHLVDSIGYLDDAIVEAEKRAGLSRRRSSVVIVQERPLLFGASPFALSARSPTNDLSAESIRRVVTELSGPRVMYLMPG